MIFAIISATVAFIALILLIIKIKSDKLNIYNIKIQEAEKEIETLLEKKLSLLSDLQTRFSDSASEEEPKFLYNLEKSNETENEFKLNAILNKAYKELKDFLDDKRSFIPDDETKNALDDLYQIDIECKATKNYYNDNCVILNNKIKKFPNNLISKLKGISKKELYNDPVEEEFEILKKK